MSTSEAATKPKVQYEDIPAELSFEEVIKNRAAPPCSLNDFMDYLVHVEHNAEPLQFFLWYWDYIERWSTLLPRQKALSPPWDPEKAANPRSHFIKYNHKRERSSKMSKVLAIMEMGLERVPSDLGRQDDAGSSISGVEISSPISSPVSSPIPSPTSILSPTDSIKPPDWQPFTIQPNRDELCRITRHYISPSGPRRLSLSSKDREACLGGVKHTTHPSALLPAFLSAEATLRARAHPAFVRWSRRNASAARLLFLRCLGTLLVALGFGLDVLLILLLQAFGPANDYSGEPWSTRYDAKSVWSKMFDETVVVQNKALVMWQDRTILFAFLWGGAGAAALTVISLFVPSGMF
ncbi:hypothetical protein C7999DRAFT_38827 [Corynascus novoguineensis]|uniref:RGS domain-containing protein n=1 Tax=Corynascus novoguineensis TaxID=1126955 RepID=A0AAN7HSK6_9PEZI|nr:hypothetical protein C7999DRAFT_38827 [Corynascus novoguineensis]